MISNTGLLKIAQKHLGQGGARFRKFAGLPAGAAWCNAFVDYVANEGGVAKLYFNGKKETYCPHSIKWCKANLAELPLWLALPMDIIYFDWDRNGNPNHIGFVRAHKDTGSIYTIEGNTSGGKVAQRTRNGKYIQGVYRPHIKGAFKLAKLTVDGECGFNTIASLQKWLGMVPNGIMTKETVKHLQRKIGATPDGCWGVNTSKKAQKYFGAKSIDGEFGVNSVKAMQKYLNDKLYHATVKKPSESKTGATKTPAKPAPAKKPTTAAKTKPQKAVEWARKIAKGGAYKYKKWNNKDKKTKLCPICHKLTGKYKGWNCIGFVSAALHHGGGIPVTCSCSGIGTDSFFTKVNINSWYKRNGKNWIMISNGGSKGGADIPKSRLQAGDVVICYDKNGKFHHVVLYSGNGKYIDCTHTKKPNIAERNYSDLCKKYHCSRAFRYIEK